MKISQTQEAQHNKDKGSTNIPIEPIRFEEDIPPNPHDNKEILLSEEKVDDYERLNLLTGLKDLEIRDKSFHLIIALIISVVVFYAFDTILINCGLKSSKLLDSIFELFKYLLSSLFGFVFALKHKEK